MRNSYTTGITWGLAAAALCFAAFAPALVLAAEAEFVPLAPIANFSPSDYIDLPVYLNKVFAFVLSIASILAVIMIIYHGIQYMIQEAVGQKRDALLGIRGAVFGLILLLMSWLILYVINPQILDLNALKVTESAKPQTSNRIPLPGSDVVTPSNNVDTGSLPWARGQSPREGAPPQ